MKFAHYTAKKETPSSLFHQHFTRAFFIQTCFVQLSLVMLQLCNFWQQNIGAKCLQKLVDEIDHRDP